MAFLFFTEMVMKRVFVLGLFTVALYAQSIEQFVGTVTGIKPGAAEVEVKADSGVVVPVRVGSRSVIQKIDPGKKNLRDAQAISLANVAVGDRVLVAIEPGETDVRRIVVMSANDISKRDEADRRDWIQRGVSGLVSAHNGPPFTLTVRTMQGSDEITVVVNDKTTYKKYAADSVKFADVMPSAFGEIKTGDQVRVRGTKSEDGTKIEAQDIVFGTFQSRAGSIVSVDAAASALSVKEFGTGKALAIHLTPDSQLKKMPDAPGMFGGRGSPGGPAALPPGGDAQPRLTPGMIPGGRGGRPPDLAQMLETMPSATLDELRPGQTVIVSSTKSTTPDALTAITLVANADILVRMAGTQSSVAGGGRGNQGETNMSGMTGLNGFELPGMIP